jgi:hypothetical protein
VPSLESIAASQNSVINLRKTKLNRKPLFAQTVQKLAWLVVAVLALALAVAPRAHAQSGGPISSSGVVTSIDDMILEIRNRTGHTETFKETKQTKWLNKRGQKLDAGDVVGKKVEVRSRWITGGSEPLSVQLK